MYAFSENASNTFLSSRKAIGSMRKRNSLSATRNLILAVLVPLCIVSVLSANPLLSILCVLVLGWLWLASLRSPLFVIMAAYLTYQWLQVSAAVWLADLYGADLGIPKTLFLTSETHFNVREMTGAAVCFGLAAISLIYLGFQLVCGTHVRLTTFRIPWSPRGLFILYLALMGVHLLSGPFTAGGLAQPLIVAGQVRLLFAALLIYRWLLQRNGGALVALVLAFELAAGFTGYFSDFKDIFFVMAVVLLTLLPLTWKRVGPLLLACIVSTLLLGTVWTAVKYNYRRALNEDRSTQAVTLSISARFEALGTLVAGTNTSTLAASIADMAARISYTDFLAVVINRIPRQEPHSGGEIWNAALENALVPRIVFPEKAALPSDSELTQRYTGMSLASDTQGTSISIGYAGETYIDFGLWWSIVIFLVMGVAYGRVTTFVIARFGDDEHLGAIGTAIVLLAPVASFEISIVKLFGGFLWVSVVVSAFASFAWPTLQPLLLGRQSLPKQA